MEANFHHQIKNKKGNYNMYLTIPTFVSELQVYISQFL